MTALAEDLQRELDELDALANHIRERVARIRARQAPRVVDREPPPEAYARVMARRRRRVR